MIFKLWNRNDLYISEVQKDSKGRLGSQTRAGSKQDEAQPRSCHRLPLFRIKPLAQLPLDTAAAGSIVLHVCHQETALQTTTAAVMNLWPCAFGYSVSKSSQEPPLGSVLPTKAVFTLLWFSQWDVSPVPHLSWGFPQTEWGGYMLRSQKCQMAFTISVTKIWTMLCNLQSALGYFSFDSTTGKVF